MKSFILIFFLCYASIAQARGLFGPEWTFTDKDLLEDASPNKMERRQRRKLNSLLLLIKERCKNECEIVNSVVRLKSNPEVYFEFVFDQNVIEVNATPLTIEQFEKHQSFFQKLLFDSAAKAGLIPHWRIGGGHIHLDVESHFRNDPLLIRNFIVDLVNHPELFLGVFGFDLLNAPPLQSLPPRFTKEFQNILKAFDAQEINIDAFIKAVNEVVYSENPVLSDIYPGTKNSAKFQLINLLNWPKTIEIRGFGPQYSTGQYLAQLKLLEARIDFLKKFRGPLLLEINNLHDQFSFSRRAGVHSYESKMNYEEILSRSRKWVEETGLAWASVQQLIRLEHRRSFQFGICQRLFR